MGREKCWFEDDIEGQVLDPALWFGARLKFL